MSAFEDSQKTSRQDVLIHKNRNSGLWSDSLECLRYLQSNKIRTLLFAGVNTDQRVVSTRLDAKARGFDMIMLMDACATDSPEYAQVSVEFNSCRNTGFCPAVGRFSRLVAPQIVFKRAGIQTCETQSFTRRLLLQWSRDPIRSC